ncbi:MAG: TetR/AcrR family transcriptional regulator [Hyphomicrobium zavarzinii]|nr:TetR/AcrR family transcriptional regulator [Hyphomicrobium zavarzinii]
MSRTLVQTRQNDAGATPPSLPPRERIMAVARDLFYRHGVHTVGVELIAEAAQTNKMTLYRHFKSKDDLVVEYARQLAAEGDAVWTKLAEAFPDNPEKRLCAWVDHVEEILTNRFERGCALANAAVELQAAHPARAVIEDYKQRKRDHLVRLFQDANYRDPEELADEVFLLFEGARISIQCGGRGPASRVVKMLRDLLATAPRVSEGP